MAELDKATLDEPGRLGIVFADQDAHDRIISLFRKPGRRRCYSAAGYHAASIIPM
jgi:hypothetical protein